MNSYALSSIYASLDNDMDHIPGSYRSHTIVLLLEKGLAVLLPCTAQKLGIHSCGFLLSYMWYTTQLLFFPYPCFGSVEMLNSSDFPLAPLLLGLSSDISYLPVVGLPVEPLPRSENFSFSKGISSVVAVNSQTNAYVAYLS
jgi:hypothetical protein